MFAIGSMLISTVTSIKAIQDWVCFASLNACFMITDDWASLVMKDNSVLTCRAENPNLAYVQKTLVNNFIHQLCGCNTCDHGELPTYPPSTLPAEDSEDDIQWKMFDETSRQLSEPVDFQYIFVALTNQLDVSNFLFERIWDKNPYKVVLCSKPFGAINTANADCRPVFECAAAHPCPAKEKEAERIARQKGTSTPTPSTKKQTGIKELWALLFLPGFVVGICAAYGFVRYRNNQLRAAREQKMRNQGSAQLTSQTVHVPIHQDVNAPHYVAPSVQYRPQGPEIQGEQTHMEIKDNVPNAVTHTPQTIHA